MLEKHVSETAFTLTDPSARQQTPDPLKYFLISILSHKLRRTPRPLSLTIYDIRGFFFFSGGKLLWTGRSCEDFSPSLLLRLSSGNQWVCVETEERPLLARGSTEPCTQLSHTCYPAQALYCSIPTHLYRLFFIQRWLYGVVLLRSVLSSPLYDYLPLISPM